MNHRPGPLRPPSCEKTRERWPRSCHPPRAPRPFHGEPSRRQASASLATNPQPLDEFAVSFNILIFQVVEKLSSAAHHPEQTGPGVVILFVDGQVLVGKSNPGVQRGNR